MTKICYLIAATNSTHGVIASCPADTESDACAAVDALFTDHFGAPPDRCRCVDVGALPSLWVQGDPAYIDEVTRP